MPERGKGILGGFRQVEIEPLPEAWEATRLGDQLVLCRQKNTRQLPLTVYSVSNVHGFIPSDEFFAKRVHSRDLSTYKVVYEDDFAYNPYRVNVGSLALFGNEEPGLVSPAYVVFRVRLKEVLEPRFLLFLLTGSRYQRQIQRTAMSRGSVRRSLAFGDLAEFVIPVPPVAEQRAIIHVLSTIQRAIQVEQKVIAAAKELKRSLMQCLFTYGPGPKPAPTKQTEIGEIPEHWDVVRVIDAVALSRKPKGLSLSDFETLPFIPMDLIPVDGTRIRGYLSKRPSEIRSGTYCEQGDVLLPKITPSFENGKQAIVAGIPIDFAYATTEVYPLKARSDILDRMFLFHLLKRPRMRTDIAGKMEGSTGRQRVPKAVIEEYLIPLPPLTEQREMADALSAVERRARAAGECKAALQELFKSMLHRLMTGQLREQDIEV